MVLALAAEAVGLPVVALGLPAVVLGLRVSLGLDLHHSGVVVVGLHHFLGLAELVLRYCYQTLLLCVV